MKRVWVADLVLLLLNVMWGYCFILIKQLLSEIPPYFLLGTRFLLAFFLLFPFQISAIPKMGKKELAWYFRCGIALGYGFCLATAGMTSTNPGKAGVIIGSLVVFVPIIDFFWMKNPISISIRVGTLTTFLGLCFISLDGVGHITEMNLGDILLLLGAIAYAFHVVIVAKTYSEIKTVNPMLLALVQIFTVGFFGLVISILFEKIPTVLSVFAIYGICFLGILGSLIAYIVQMWAQKYAPAPHVGVILSTEAVFACIFSYFILGEAFTFFMWIGGILVLAGIMLTQEILPFGRRHVTKTR